MQRIENYKVRSSAGNQTGITMIELMVVVAIVAILATFGALGMEFIERERVASTTKEVLADLQKQRMDGLIEGPTSALPKMKGMGIRFASANSYTLFKFNDCDENFNYNIDTCSGSTREEANAKAVNLPASIALKKNTGGVAVNFTNAVTDVVIFDRFGFPRNHQWEEGGFEIVVTSTRNAGLTKCIIISTNKVREGVWNGSACAEQ